MAETTVITKKPIPFILKSEPPRLPRSVLSALAACLREGLAEKEQRDESGDVLSGELGRAAQGR